MKKYSKVLSANDVGQTSSHQVGVHIPKTGVTPLAILPALDSRTKNPFVWIEATDLHDRVWKLRFIYYNSKLHPQIDENGEKKGLEMSTESLMSPSSFLRTMQRRGTPSF